MNNPFKPDPPKPYKHKMTLNTPTHIYHEGYPGEKDLPSKPSLTFSGYKHRGWLMSRPAGRWLVYGLIVLAIVIFVWTSPTIQNRI